MSIHREVKVGYALARSYLAYVLRRPKAPMPCYFNIDPSSACNLKCVFCPQSDPPENMSFGLMETEEHKIYLNLASPLTIRGRNTKSMILHGYSSLVRTPGL